MFAAGMQLWHPRERAIRAFVAEERASLAAAQASCVSLCCALTAAAVRHSWKASVSAPAAQCATALRSIACFAAASSCSCRHPYHAATRLCSAGQLQLECQTLKVLFPRHVSEGLLCSHHAQE